MTTSISRYIPLEIVPKRRLKVLSVKEREVLGIWCTLNHLGERTHTLTHTHILTSHTHSHTHSHTLTHIFVDSDRQTHTHEILGPECYARQMCFCMKMRRKKRDENR
jgi:hypothetical protein